MADSCSVCGDPADVEDVITGDPLCKDCAQRGVGVLR